MHPTIYYILNKNYFNIVEKILKSVKIFLINSIKLLYIDKESSEF
jgi:hypothetical protein